MINTNTSDAKYIAVIYLRIILYIILTLTAVGSILHYITLIFNQSQLAKTLNELSVILIWSAITTILISPMIISIILAIYYFMKKNFIGLALTIALVSVILTAIILISI